MKNLVMERISKRYGEKQVLQELSLTLRPGSVTSVMGPSGCGKTTLLNIVAGLVKPDSGRVLGRPGRVGFVFQEDRLCMDFSAAANIRLVTGKTGKDPMMYGIFSALGLQDSIMMPVREMSGGMKRRVAIARALCYQPELLLLDEAFKGLDAQIRQQTMDCVLKWRGDCTVLCVTHERAEADYLGGALLQLGRTADREEGEQGSRFPFPSGITREA